MEQGVQQNAALVQEAADATSALAQQASVLQSVVARSTWGETPANAGNPTAGQAGAFTLLQPATAQ